MKTKRNILPWIMIFVVFCSVTCSFSLVEAAKAGSNPDGRSGGLLGEIFSRDKGPKSADQASASQSKKTNTRSSSGESKGVFPPWKKRTESEKAAQEEGEVILEEEFLEEELPMEYTENFDQAPPITPSYGAVEVNIRPTTVPAVETSAARNTTTSMKLDAAEPKAVAPLPGESPDRTINGVPVKETPQLTLTTQEVGARSLGDPAQRLSSPTWDVLDRDFLRAEHTRLETVEKTVDFGENPLPPLPDEVMQRSHIGTEVMLKSQGMKPRTENDFETRSFMPERQESPRSDLFTAVDTPASVQAVERQIGGGEVKDLFGVEPETPFRTNVNVVEGEETAVRAISPDKNRMIRERPIIEINTQGPPKIAVGTKVTYEIDIKNSGDFVAEDICVNIKIPRWVDVVHASGTVGSFELKKMTDQELSLGEWSIGDVRVNKHEKLLITVIPKEKRAFDLDVTWKSQQSSTLRRVTVEEPKLELELIGKETAILGRPESFMLKIYNVGNCTAESTRFFVLSDGDESGTAIAQNVGDIPAGEVRAHSVQFLAKQPGSTNFRVRVTTESGTEVMAEKSVKIQFSDLKLKIAPIPPQYVGVESIYRLYVSNLGTAETTDARMKLEFPNNLELVSQDKKPGMQRGRVEWDLGGISPGETREFSVTLRPTLQGEVTMNLTAESKYTTPASLDIPVLCQAMANMKIELVVPEKPLLMTESGEYQIHVTNTGSEAIYDAVVQFFFSEGLEPRQAPGAAACGNGVVRFDSQPLQAGAKRIFTVEARGVYAGKHSVRAQVTSDSKELELLEQKSAFYR